MKFFFSFFFITHLCFSITFTPTNLSVDACRCSDLCQTTNQNGTNVVLWGECLDGISGYLKCAIYNGGSWNYHTISGAVYGFTDKYASVDALGNIVAVWAEKTSSSPAAELSQDITLKLSRWNGLTWSPQTLSENNYQIDNLQIISNENNIVIAWEEISTDFLVNIKAIAWDGINWSSVQTIANNTYIIEDLSLEFLNTNTAILDFINNKTNGKYQIQSVIINFE